MTALMYTAGSTGNNITTWQIVIQIDNRSPYYLHLRYHGIQKNGISTDSTIITAAFIVALEMNFPSNFTVEMCYIRRSG
jgi:hypothetical protein